MARSEVPQPDLGPIFKRIRERDKAHWLEGQVRFKANDIFLRFGFSLGGDNYGLEVPVEFEGQVWKVEMRRRHISNIPVVSINLLRGQEIIPVYRMEGYEAIVDKISGKEADLESLIELNSLLNNIRSYSEAQPVVRTGTRAKDAQRITS